MKKLFTTLLVLMCATMLAPCASAVNTDPMPLPWTPELGNRKGSVSLDFKEYFVSLKGSNSNTKGWNYTSSNGWSFRSLPNKTGSKSSPNKVAQNSFLLLPPMEFTAGECYLLTFKAYSDDKYSSGKGSFQVFLSADRTEEDILGGQVIVPNSILEPKSSDFGKFYSIYFVPDSTGVQTITFHCTSEGSANGMYLSDVNSNMLVKLSHASLPSEPTNISVVPDTNGLKEAVVNFTAPTTTVLGQPLTDITFIDVLLNGNRVARVDNPVAGQEYSVNIKSSQAVNAKISVVGGNNYGSGIEASVSCVIGEILNKPTVANRRVVIDGVNEFWKEYSLHAVFNDGNTSLSWDADETEGATYTLKRYPGGNVIASGLTENSYEDTNVSSDYPKNFQYELITYVGEDIISQGIYSNLIAINNDVPYAMNFLTPESDYEINFEDFDDNPFVFDSNTPSLSIGWGDVKSDWAITPSVKLEAGKYYKFDITTATGGRAFNFKVKAGKSNTSESMNIDVIESYIETALIKNGGSSHTGFFQVEESGSYFFGVQAWLDERFPHSGVIFSINVVEVDPMLPNAVEGLNVKFNSEDPTKAKLYFNAPSKSVSGQDIQNITSIIVYKDGEKISVIDNPIPGSAHEVDIEVLVGDQIVYNVIPYLGENEGVANELPVCIVTAPYTNEFTYNKDLLGYTISDLNGDSYSWSVYRDKARAYASSDKGMDDWLITPPIHLEGGYFYKLSYLTSLENADESGVANSEVTLFMGNDAAIDSLTNVAIAPYAPKTGVDNSVLLKDYVWVETTGEYYFGWHAVGNTSLYIDNFSISDIINPGVPNLTTNLSIVPDNLGGMSGVISFTSTALTLKGEELSGNIDYTVYRDGLAVFTKTVAPNEEVSFTDEGMTEGVHLYTVVPKNNLGIGREAEGVAFFGINRPNVPNNFKVVETETYGIVLLTWEAPTTDYDGFPINPDLITYDIFLYNANDGTETSVATGLTDLSYTHVAKASDDPQTFLRYGIRSRTRMGGSPGLLAKSINVGEPYSLPVRESFAGCNTTICQMSEMLDGLCQWGYNSIDNQGVSSFDGDDGMAIMESAFAGSEARLFTGKVRISGDAPYMSLYVYNCKNNGDDINDFAIEVGKPGDWKVIAEKTINDWANGLDGWQKIRIDLSDYKDQVVQFAFRAKSNKYVFTHFDNWIVAESGNNDLTISSYDNPRRVNPCEVFPISLSVKNNGVENAENYTINLLRENELIATIDGDLLEAGNTKVYEFTDSISKNAEKDTYNYTIDLRYSADCDLTDNRVNNIEISLRSGESLPVAANLNAVQVESDVHLSWQAPELPSEAKELTDGVEDFDAWLGMNNILGDYINLDLDNRAIIYGTGLAALPIAQRDKEAWFVMDTSCDEMQNMNKEYNYPLYTAHSGDKCFASAGLSDREANNNDWLILPELTGEAQTIKLWARTCMPTYTESMVFSISSKSSFVKDFVVVEQHMYVPSEWTEYSIDVPEGTKYFAIRHVSVAGFYLMVDDITYKPLGNETLEVEGYKVYHNEELLATTDKDANSFVHPDAEFGDHEYAVAVKYNKGESADIVTSLTTSVVESVYSCGPYVYGADNCIVVTAAEGMDVNVFDTAGAHLYQSSGNMSIPMQPGIYLVKVANNSFKVVVK